MEDKKEDVVEVDVTEVQEPQKFYVLLYKMAGSPLKWWSLGVYDDYKQAINSIPDSAIEHKIIKFKVDCKL